jgi:hypothetical protein
MRLGCVALLSLVLLAPAPAALGRPGRHGHEHGGHGHQQMKYRARMGPPPVRVEVRPAMPGPRHVWVPGYWGWRNERHFWVTGVWRMPPRQNWVWVEPQWVNDGGGWGFVEGHWQAAPQL